MDSFERRVDLIKLVREDLHSGVLSRLLSLIGAREFFYVVEITHYLPEVPGKFDGRPENCYPSEAEELEYEPFHELEYLADKAFARILEKLKRHRDYKCYNNVPSYVKWFTFYYSALALLLAKRSKFVRTFIEHEQKWVDSDEAYNEARAVALTDTSFDPFE